MTKGMGAGRFNPTNTSAFGTRHAKLNSSNLWSEVWPARFGQDLMNGAFMEGRRWFEIVVSPVPRFPRFLYCRHVLKPSRCELRQRP